MYAYGGRREGARSDDIVETVGVRAVWVGGARSVPTAHLHTYTCTYACMHACACVCKRMHACGCMHVCACSVPAARLYMCMHVRTHAYVCKHTHMYVCIRMCAPAFIPALPSRQSGRNCQRDAYAYIHVHMRAHSYQPSQVDSQVVTALER